MFIPFSMSSRRTSGDLLTGPMVQTMPESLILLAVEYMLRLETYSMLVLLSRALSCPAGTLHFSKMDCKKEKLKITKQIYEQLRNLMMNN